MHETDNALESKVLSGFNAFLRQHGLATFIALVFLWFLNEDRHQLASERLASTNSTTAQLEQLNTQIAVTARLLTQHHDDTRKDSLEWTRILLAQCLNLSSTIPERDRCMGLR